MGDKKVVLVAEDTRTQQDYIRFHLDQAGYTVLQAFDGEAAYRMACDHLPDVIILDLTMPRRDGRDVCAALQRDPLTATIPIIMATSRDSEYDEALGYDLGAAEYLTKPLDEHTLVSAIERQLRRKARL